MDPQQKSNKDDTDYPKLISNVDFTEDEIIEIRQTDLKVLEKQQQPKKKHLFNITYYFPEVDGIDHSQLKLTNISIYSTTPWRESKYITQSIINQIKHLNKPKNPSIDLSKWTITDATSNVGGNTISFFMKGFGRVNAVEIDKLTCDILKNNLTVYGYSTNNVYCTDYLDIYLKLTQDVVFIDPPWGGPDYKKAKVLDLFLGKTNLIDICYDLMDKSKTKMIVMKLPINYNLPALINKMPPDKKILVQKIYRYKGHHSYNIVTCF